MTAPNLADTLSADELLSALGPAWSEMSAAERRAYGPAEAHRSAAGTVAQRFPARALWIREVCAGRHGQRPDGAGTWRLDALWRAASWEQAALDAARSGFGDTFRGCMARARQELAAAVAAKHPRTAA